MNIKVKQTKNLDGRIVTRGKLIILDISKSDFRTPIKNSIINDKGMFKPIIISEEEKITINDWYIDETNQIRQSIIDNEDYWNRRENYHKILALPEHLSPEILQMIVNGDLIDGQDLWVECKKVCIGDTDMKGGCLCSSRHCEELATIIKLIYNHINIFPIQQNPQLQKALDIYIKEKHTQEECIGFIDGFEKAMELLKI